MMAPERWLSPDGGPRYRQLAEHIARRIEDRSLDAGAQLPAERDLAEAADVSRVTVRKALAELAARGLVAQRRGAGSFVCEEPEAPKHSLSSIMSFTETLAAQGVTSSSTVLMAGLFAPSSDEMIRLGVSASDQVARVHRLRRANDTPTALERSALPADILPEPERVQTSLYAVLRSRGVAPSRAVQKIGAVTAEGADAERLGVLPGAALLKVDRTAYLETGRPIEFTTGLYRSDNYDFVTEIRSQ